MIVREATLADAEAAARAHAASAEAVYGRPRDLARTIEAWREAIAGNGYSAWLAVEGEDVIGVLSVSAAELKVLYVVPERWGTGAGQALIDKAHELLAQTTLEAGLTVLAGNPRARRFYERNGWELEETLVEPHFGGVPTEVCKYRRRFRGVSDTEGA